MTAVKTLKVGEERGSKFSPSSNLDIQKNISKIAKQIHHTQITFDCTQGIQVCELRESKNKMLVLMAGNTTPFLNKL